MSRTDSRSQEELFADDRYDTPPVSAANAAALLGAERITYLKREGETHPDRVRFHFSKTVRPRAVEDVTQSTDVAVHPWHDGTVAVIVYTDSLR